MYSVVLLVLYLIGFESRCTFKGGEYVKDCCSSRWRLAGVHIDVEVAIVALPSIPADLCSDKLDRSLSYRHIVIFR